MPDKEPVIDESKDAELLREMRERYSEEILFWRPIWDEGDADMRALSFKGDWDSKARSEREASMRPVTHTDIISQFNNRLVNQFRMRKRGFTFVSNGPNATDKTAELREARARQIQYESKAFTARLTALQNAVDRGIGHWKISTERIHPKTFNKRIIIERIPNVKSVVIDHHTRKSDRSDIRYAWHIDKHYTEDAFKKEFPKAKIQSFDMQHQLEAKGWIGKNDILVAQYYRVEVIETRLLLVEGYPMKGQEQPILEADLPAEVDLEKAKIIKEEPTEIRKVWIHLTNGIEFLGKPSLFEASIIPILTTVGREKWVDNKLEVESLTRKMREPQRQYDFADSAEVEDVGMSPKPKWLVEEGQVDGFDEWTDANKNNYPYLRFRRMIEGVEANRPERVDSSVDMTKYEVVKNSALRAAQNAVGMTTADAKDRQSKSGVAQDKLDESADINGFHFTDNCDDVIELEGRIINEMMDKVEDSVRTVGLRTKDDQFKTQELQVQQGSDGEVTQHPYGAPEDHGVTVEVGPDSSSQRQEAQEFLSKFMDSLKGTPEYARVAYLILQFQNLGPVMDQAVENLTPADIRQQQEAEKQGQPPIPPQVQEQMAQMKQHLQQVMALLKQQAQVIDSKQIEMQARKDIELGKADFQKTVDLAKIEADKYKTDMSRENTLITAKAKTDTAHTSAISDQTIAAESHSLEWDLAEVARLAGAQQVQADQAHQVGMQGLDQQHQLGMAGLQQGHEQDMAAQAAENQPEPTA